jgi:hypothetical protein
MDLNFPRPMLNSPAESGAAAGNAFYASVVRRAQKSREGRRVLHEVLDKICKQIVPQEIRCNCSTCRTVR